MKRHSIEIQEDTKKELRKRSKNVGLSYDSFIKLLLKATESEVGINVKAKKCS